MNLWIESTVCTTSVQLKIATRVHSKTRETWPVSEVIIVIFIKFRFINITGAPSHFAVTRCPLHTKKFDAAGSATTAFPRLATDQGAHAVGQLLPRPTLIMVAAACMADRHDVSGQCDNKI